MNIKNFKNPSNEYLPYSFFFLNGEYTSDELIKNIKRLEEKGLSVGYIQERGAKNKPFLSDGFFEDFKTILENTKLPMGYCDERGGMYGCSALECNAPLSQSLKWEEIYCENNYVIPECFCSVVCETENNTVIYDSIREVRSGETVSKGKTVYIFNLYHKRSLSGSDIDYLNPESADFVINSCYEKIKKNVGEYFGNRLTGAFMDLEGDFGYKLAHSDKLKEIYESLYEDSYIKNLVLLFKEDDKGIWMRSRYRWYNAVSEVYNEFFRKLASWHKENNLEFTGHTWEENLYGQVLQVGDFYKIAKNFSMIGVDSLRLECYSPRDFLEAKTIADKENKKFMCEALGCAGFSLSASEIKRAVNCMTAWGVNHFIFHGVYTDQRIDKIGFAPDISIDTYFDYFNNISDYIKRTSYINSITKMCADTVLLNPIDSVKALLGDYVMNEKNEFSGYIIEQRDMLKCNHGLEIREIEETYSKTIDALIKKNIEFYIYDSEYFLSDNFCGIKNIIIPSMCIISEKVINKIITLSEQGVSVYFAGKLPYATVEKGIYTEIREEFLKITNAKSNLNIKSKIETNIKNLITSHRIKDKTHYFWCYNNSSDTVNGSIKLKELLGDVSILNCETGEEKEAFFVKSEKDTEVYVKFEPYEAFYVVLKEETIVLCNFQKSGNIYETEIEINDFSKVVLELGEVYHVAEVFVNGASVGARLWEPYNFDISSFLIKGKNTIKIKVGGLLPSCLKEYGMRWQTGIHRQNPIESYRSGICGKPAIKII